MRLPVVPTAERTAAKAQYVAVVVELRSYFVRGTRTFVYSYDRVVSSLRGDLTRTLVQQYCCTCITAVVAQLLL